MFQFPNWSIQLPGYSYDTDEPDAFAPLNVMHYTFLARCNLLGKVIARSLCADPDGIDREEVHRRVSAEALNVFNRTLRDGSEARK